MNLMTIIQFKRTLSVLDATISTLLRDEGHGVTDFAMVVALIAVGAIAGLNSVATTVNSALSSMATTVSSMGGVVIHHL